MKHDFPNKKNLKQKYQKLVFILCKFYCLFQGGTDPLALKPIL